MPDPKWREKEPENNSDEDSGLALTFNDSAASTSTQIAHTNQSPPTTNPLSPFNQELENQLSNLNINDTENAENQSEIQPPQNIENTDQENNMDQPRNPGIGPIHQAVKNLPYFDGNPKMLRQFITSLQHLSESYGAESDQWILTYIPNRLKGRALMAFGGNASTYESVADFLNAVKAEFGGIHDLDTLRMELYQVQQEEAESVSEYAIRVKDIEQRLLAAYEAKLEGNIPNPDPNKQRLLEDILEAFLHGLKNPPEYQVAAKNPRTLAEASRYAETLEKRHQFAMSHRNIVKSSLSPQRKSKSPVRKFQLRDDIDNDSDSSLIDNNEILSLVQLLKEIKTTANINLTTASKNHDNRQKPELEFNDRLSCRYCKNIGHDLNHCQLLLNTLSKEENLIENVKNVPPRNFDYRNDLSNFYNRYQPRNQNFNFNRNSYGNFNRENFPRNFYNPNTYPFRRNNFNYSYRNNFPRTYNNFNQPRFNRDYQNLNFSPNNNSRNEFFRRNDQNFSNR